MGGGQSKQKRWAFTDANVDKIASSSHFSPFEVRKLYPHFERISKSIKDDGVVDVEEFKNALGIKSAGFAERIFRTFDTSGDFNVDFPEYVAGLSALSPRASIEEKARFCFQVYDLDGNGSIDRSELREVIEFSLKNNDSVSLTPEQKEKIVQTTFSRMDSDGNGKISFEEFLAGVKAHPVILSCVSLEMSKIIS